MLSRLYPFIKITVLDGIRSKVVVGVIMLSIVSGMANIVIANLAAQDVGKVAIDFELSSFSLMGLFVILFACGGSLYRDIDKKTVALTLSRAVSRKEYILCRYFGYLITIFFVAVTSTIIGLVTLYLIKILHPKHFVQNFSGVIIAHGFAFLGFLMLLSVLIFFSSMTTSSFTAMLLTIMVYFIGNSIGDLRDFAESQASIAAGFPESFRFILRIVHFIVPDLSKFDLKVFAANELPLDNNFITFSIAYAIVYCSILLLLSMKVFERREFI
jgi:ABC-type transport system involved in multi-copper enzyme maturation permease subunit